MTTKKIDNSRRVHAVKVLAHSTKTRKGSVAISTQYGIIRRDIRKLRTDLAHGYDLIKQWMETKISRRLLVRSK